MQKSVSTEGAHPSQKLTFDIPTEFVSIPSQGRIYGVDTNLHDLKEIEIRVMTARDEDILTSPSLIRKGIAIDRLLQNIIVDKSIHIDDLIRGDRDALLIALRITGYGESYEAKIGCPECSETTQHEFSLSGLEVKNLQIEPIQEYSNRFYFKLPVSKKEITWKFLTGKEERDITETTNRQKKQNPGRRVDNLVTLKLINTIVSVDGITDRGQIAAFVRNMPARDSLELRKYMDENEPKIIMNNWFECPDCGTESEVAIPMAIQFFWPNLTT